MKLKYTTMTKECEKHLEKADFQLDVSYEEQTQMWNEWNISEQFEYPR